MAVSTDIRDVKPSAVAPAYCVTTACVPEQRVQMPVDDPADDDADDDDYDTPFGDILAAPETHPEAAGSAEPSLFASASASGSGTHTPDVILTFAR